MLQDAYDLPISTSSTDAAAFDPAIESYFKAHLLPVIILGASADADLVLLIV